MAPWLEALAHHSVWTLPQPESSLDHSEEANPAPAHRRVALGRSLGATPLSQAASSRSLFGLASSTSSAPRSPSSSSRRPNDNQSPLKRSRSAQKAPAGHEKRVKGARVSRVALIRGTDLVVAVGRQLRLASLADVKSRCGHDDQLDAEDVELEDYKLLNTPAITFEIQQLVVNPTSKLLAVIGDHSVVVVVLPRRGWTNSLSKTLECRCLPVGAFYHSLPGSPSVAAALWHPLGHDASSLLILTSDSTLREYTVSETLEEPAQTLSFSRSDGKSSAVPAGRGYGLSAVDRDASTAVAMCVGEGKGDWGPLTVYALMRNGDILSLCPFLPKKASLSPAYVHALSAFVSTKVNYLASTSDPSDPFSAAASASEGSPSGLKKRYSLQQQYVSSLVRQITTQPPSARPALLAGEGEAEEHQEAHDPMSPKCVIAPSRPALAPRLQGPFLLQPAPADLDNGADDAACDLTYLTYSPSSNLDGGTGLGATSEEEAQGDGVGVIAIAYRDGKIDLCLEVEKVEARFVGEATPRPAASSARAGAVVLHPSKGKGPRGFGAAAFESDEDEDQHEDADEDPELADLPTLAVYESIDLGLAKALSPAGEERLVATALAQNTPVLARDPLYADTLYVRHALGTHCLFLGPWLKPLAEALAGGGEEDDELEKELGGVLRTQNRTEVCWVLKTLGTSPYPDVGDEDSPEKGAAVPVEGLALLNDVYLGYSLLLVTSALQPVGIELALRIDPSTTVFDEAAAVAAAAPATPAKRAPGGEPAYVSLLTNPFTVPDLLSRRPGQPPAIPRLPTTKTELRITPDTLRLLGKHVSATQTAVRDLVSACGTVTSRVELQMRELVRQLGKLRELDERRTELGKSVGAGGVEARVRAAEDRQHELLARTDRVLQRLVESHQPQVSAVERKWFGELERLRDQVEGPSEEDGDGEENVRREGSNSLVLRAQRLEAQMELLRPALEELRRREEAKRTQGTPARAGPGGMGHTQLQRVESVLSDEAKLLAETKRKVERLTSTLATASLGA